MATALPIADFCGNHLPAGLINPGKQVFFSSGTRIAQVEGKF
jgi:hypothetical protein